ncbi:hypothetical protein NMG60_11003189 [Bertholletia excelsa]
MNKEMDFTVILASSFLVVLLCSPLASSQSTAAPPTLPPTPTPTPAPAPAPEYVNLADLLSVAGPFQTFLNYLQSTKTMQTFQNQANDTVEGLTLFVPKDQAFKSLKNPSLSNLTEDQIKQLCLFHALPHYYTLADFVNLSQTGPVDSMAGDDYSLNFTDVSGTVQLDSGWTRTKVSSAVHATEPVAIYQVDKVLLPEAIFGTDIPPVPAPAPAPDIAPAADTEKGGSGLSPTSLFSSSGYSVAKLGAVCVELVYLVVLAFGYLI